MLIGIFGKTFAGRDVSAVFAAAKASGFDGVQHNWASCGLAPLPVLLPDGVALETTDAARVHGLRIEALSGTANLIHPDPVIRQQGIDALKVSLQAAPALGAPIVTLCTGSRNAGDQWAPHRENASPQAWRDLLASLEQIIPLAQELGLKLGVEPELANVVNSARAARRLLDELASEVLCIVFDPANLFEAEGLEQQRAIIAQALDLLTGRIAMAHAKDRTSQGAFAAAGQGVLDYPFFINGLRQAGFDGPLITHGLEPADAPGVAAFLRGLVG